MTTSINLENFSLDNYIKDEKKKAARKSGGRVGDSWQFREFVEQADLMVQFEVVDQAEVEADQDQTRGVEVRLQEELKEKTHILPLKELLTEQGCQSWTYLSTWTTTR